MGLHKITREEQRKLKARDRLKLLKERESEIDNNARFRSYRTYGEFKSILHPLIYTGKEIREIANIEKEKKKLKDVL